MPAVRPGPLRCAAVHRRARHLLLSGAAVVAVAGVASCDTDDGRDLREPTLQERTEATNAASTTTTTIAGAVTTTASVASTPVTVVGGSASTGPAPTTAAATVDPSGFALTTPWPDTQAIDARFTCDGDDQSPALTWTAPPPGAVELALVVTDEDIGFLHWALTGLDPAAGALEQGVVPDGILQGFNDFAERGWSGPCPPAGSTHTYRFELFALDAELELPDDPDARDIVAAIEGVQFATATVTGTYTRPE